MRRIAELADMDERGEIDKEEAKDLFFHHYTSAIFAFSEYLYLSGQLNENGYFALMKMAQEGGVDRTGQAQRSDKFP
jgi:hypothetical protein